MYLISLLIIYLILSNNCPAKSSNILSEPDPNHPKEKFYSPIPENVSGINQFDEKGNTPLMNAIISGHYEAAKNLVKGGANPNITTNNNETALILAAERGLYHCVRVLLESFADVHQKSATGKNAILAAVIVGHADIVEILLKYNSDPNQILHGSQSLLMVASSYSKNPYVVKYLIRAGAEINYRDANMSTPLMFACTSGSLEIVKILAENTADIDAQNELGFTALMFATSRSHIEIVKYLISIGSDMNVKDIYGRSALGIAMEFEFEYREIIDLLYESGVDTEHYNINPSTELINKRNEALIRMSNTSLSANINFLGNI